jgi:WD40 repeat protein
MLFRMCFAPDGGRVLTACRDGQASLWDWQSGHLVSNLRQGRKRCSSQKDKM